jgi:hypothetical protein
MRAHVRSSMVAGLAIAGIGALVVTPIAPLPADQSPRTVVREVRLAAAPPPGALLSAAINNQVQFCSIICPFIVQGAVTVPLGAARAPAAFLASLAGTGSLTKSIGAAAASVTGPANAAAEGIILNDVFRVVPKAFNNFEVTVVQLFNVGSAVFQPAEFPQAVNTARETILTALNQPLPPPVPTETGAETLPQVVAVEAIKVAVAVAFQAGELLLLGVVQTADATAQELARTGDPAAALAAGATQARDAVDTAGGIVVDAVQTAAANIRDSLEESLPSATPARRSAVRPAANAVRIVARPAEPARRSADRPAANAVRLVAKPGEPKRSGTAFTRNDETAKPDESRRPGRGPVRKVVDNLRQSVKDISESQRNSLTQKRTGSRTASTEHQADRGGAGR